MLAAHTISPFLAPSREFQPQIEPQSHCDTRRKIPSPHKERNTDCKVNIARKCCARSAFTSSPCCLLSSRRLLVHSRYFDVRRPRRQRKPNAELRALPRLKSAESPLGGDCSLVGQQRRELIRSRRQRSGRWRRAAFFPPPPNLPPPLFRRDRRSTCGRSAGPPLFHGSRRQWHHSSIGQSSPRVLATTARIRFQPSPLLPHEHGGEPAPVAAALLSEHPLLSISHQASRKQRQNQFLPRRSIRTHRKSVLKY